MVTGMWYILRTGIPWRDLPAHFGPWSSVYTRFRRWCASGLWARLLATIARGAVGKIRCVDCSHIKVHRDAANTIGGQANQAMGRTKGGLNTKLAAVVDGIGRAVGLKLAPGQQHDLRACAPLQPHLEGRWTVADRAFDSNGFRRALASSAGFNCIPPCSRRRTPIHFDRELYRHRHVVENFFSRIKRHRRIATRYEKLAVTFHGFVCFAAVLDWLNHEV
jgi:transposase